MKVKIIRGSVQYDGTVYSEGMEIIIRSEDFAGLAEVAEALDEAEEKIEVQSAAEGSNPANYKAMKKEELVELAKEKGLNIPADAKKDEIITLLEEAIAHE